MGKVSKIEYVDASWGPWRGCHPVSVGCANCYAAETAKRRTLLFPYGFNTLVRAGEDTFYAPLGWKDSLRIFVCEWSDFLHPDVDIEWYTNAVEVMRKTPRHTYLIVTKRPERWTWFAENWPDVAERAWLAVTAETQEHLDNRGTHLVNVPAAKRIVSLEPLLGPLSFRWALWQPFGNNPGDVTNEYDGLRRFDWVIVGAESGPNRRECKIEWIEDIVAQCKAANVPVFVKQGSHRFPGRQGDIPDHLWKIKEIPE